MKVQTHPDCPPSEALSNWYDNGGDSRIENHLDQCEACVHTVTFYRRVDDTVRLTAMPPADLAGNIARACHGLEGEILAFPWWIKALRLAAVVAIVGTVAGMLHLLNPEERQSEPRPVAVALPSQAEHSAELSVAIVDPIPIPIPVPSLLGDRLDVRSTGGLGAADLLPVSLNSGSRPAPVARWAAATIDIGDTVRHVWVVDNLETSRTVFERNLPAGIKPCSCREEETRLCFEIKLTDRQLQQLVDNLRKAGWALFTKEFPQPGEADRVALSDRRIQYFAELVRKAE